MYLSFYGLNEKPFNLTPDANFLYPSQIHREVLGHLLFGIENRRGFILITGEVGAGKTTLCRVLLNQLDENTEVAFVLNSFLTEFELLKAINEDFGIATTGRTRKELIDELNRFLLERRAGGKNIVVIIDEAQNLSIPVLEQLRMLSNIETEKEKLLQIVLVGQPELNQILKNEKIRQLNQRISVRHHICPLSKEELKEYIYFRLDVAGSKGNVIFNDNAIDTVYRYSRGIPRAINLICDQALLVGYVANSRRITRAMVQKAVKEVWGNQPDDAAGRTGHRVKTVLSRAFVGITIMAALTFTSVFFLNNIKGSQNNLTGMTRVHETSENEQSTSLSVPATPNLDITEKQEITIPTVEKSTPQTDGPPAVISEEDIGPSSLIMAAIDSGGGRMLGRELNDLDVSSALSGTDEYTTVDEETAPPDEIDQITSWSSDIDATVDLLRLWKVEQKYIHSLQVRYQNKAVEPEKVAKVANMGYAVLNMDLDRLRILNLPAVAQVKTKGGRPGYVVISSLSDDSATVLVSSRKMEVNVDELAALLTGDMVLYCADEFVDPLVLYRGMEMSLGVRKVQDYLKELKYFHSNCNGWFTDDTEIAVLDFQTDNGLKATGKVTGYMKLLIYSRLPSDNKDIPRLVW